MAGTKKEKKSPKKSKKKADGAHIAPGLMPKCMFVAVPRIPPPPAVAPDFGDSLNASILNASVLGRLFATPEPPVDMVEEHEVSDHGDTDTSLYDYERAETRVLRGNQAVPNQRVPIVPARKKHNKGGGEPGHNDTDEDNPLYDVVHDPKIYHEDNNDADAPGYSSVEYRDGHMRYMSPADRDQMQTPELEDHMFYDDDSEYGAGNPRSRSLSPDQGRGSPMYSIEEERMFTVEDSSPLYAEIQKPRKKKIGSNSDLTNVSSLHEDLVSPVPTTSLGLLEEEDNVDGRGLGTSSRPSTSHSRPRSPSPHALHSSNRSGQMVNMIESQTLTHSEVHSSKKSSFRVDDLNHTSSPKLVELERQNAALMSQQVALQEQLHQQQQQQLEILQRLQQEALNSSLGQPDQTSTQDMGSLLQETQSVTEGTMKQQQSLIQSYHERCTVLEKEKQELQDLNEQLQAEIISLRRMASIKGSDEPLGTQTLVLKKQLQDYKEERETLHTTVHRLNVELSRYQAKYRPPDRESSEMIGLPSKGPKPSWLINTKYLAPIFLAYDDRLAEKDHIIQNCDSELESFRERIEEIIKENQRLHLRLEQTDVSGPISMTEWKQLQEQCKLVLEENQLLMEQLDIQQNKAKDMHKAHVQEVARLSKRSVVLEGEKVESERLAHEATQTLANLKQKHDSAIIENKSKMALEDHITAIGELKRGIEDEKFKHSREVENMKTKLQSIQADKKMLSSELDDVRLENKQLESEVKLLTKSLRKTQRKLLVLQKVLEDLESREQSASHYLSSVVKVAEQTAAERDTFAQVVQTQGQQNKKAINKLLEGNVTVGRMEEKLKLVKMKASEKLERAVHRLKQQDNDFNQQRAEYEREIKHMRLLLKEKDEMMQSLTGEKRQVEDDLEIVWQSASADNRRMRDTLKKSIRKLREHATLEALMSDDEDRDELLMSDT